MNTETQTPAPAPPPPPTPEPEKPPAPSAQAKPEGDDFGADVLLSVLGAMLGDNGKLSDKDAAELKEKIKESERESIKQLKEAESNRLIEGLRAVAHIHAKLAKERCEQLHKRVRETELALARMNQDLDDAGIHMSANFEHAARALRNLSRSLDDHRVGDCNGQHAAVPQTKSP